MKTNVSQQTKELLGAYSDKIMKEIPQILFDVGLDAADELKSVGGFKNRTGKYRRSWDVKQEEHRTYVETIVHAKTPEYRLTHLLEFGHATANGGRTKAFPHIRTVNDKAVEDAEKKIVRMIQEIRIL